VKEAADLGGSLLSFPLCNFRFLVVIVVEYRFDRRIRVIRNFSLARAPSSFRQRYH